MASFTVESILAQLDAAAGSFTFPALDNGYYYPVDVRLHAFADGDRWALVIEAVGYNPRGSNLFDVLHFYGNCLDGPPGFADEDFLPRIDNMDELEDPAEPEAVAPGASGAVIRGRTLAPCPAAGTRLVDLFRSLVPEHRDLLLATAEEVRARIPADLPRLVQLEEWSHPDVTAGDPPSSSPTFRQLAQVLATGDPCRYDPSEPPNTHWSNWPEGGGL